MRKNTAIFVLAVLGILVLANIISVRAFGRFDLTDKKAYTLAPATRDLLKGLEDPVTVKAYFTADLPPQVAGVARYVRDTLEEYRSASKGKLSFEFIDPQAQETEEDKEKKKEVKHDIFGRAMREQTSVERELGELGIPAININTAEEDQKQVKRAYMGIVVRYQEKKEVIPVVQNIGQLEYELTTLIRKLTRPKTPVLAVLQGHDEPKLEEQLKGFHQLLSQTYDVRSLDLGTKDKIDDNIDTLWIIGPKTPLKPNEIKAIDQFLMQGKNVAMLLDVVRVDSRTLEGSPANHGLGPLLATCGVTLGDQLVGDLQSHRIQAQENRNGFPVLQLIPYPLMPVLPKLEGDSPLTQGITNLMFPFVTEVSVKEMDGIAGTVFAQSSPKSWLDAKPPNTDPRRWINNTEDIQFGNRRIPLMVQVAGKLKSHFANDAQSASGDLLMESKSEARLVVAGGSSFLWDAFMSQPNAVFVQNLADWLVLDPGMLAIRGRGLAEAPINTDISDAKRNLVKFGNVFGMPLLLAAWGFARWRMREGRRSQPLLESSR